VTSGGVDWELPFSFPSVAESERLQLHLDHVQSGLHRRRHRDFRFPKVSAVIMLPVTGKHQLAITPFCQKKTVKRKLFLNAYISLKH